MADPYATLEVERTASAAEIKKSYRRLAKKLHPDLNPGNKKVEQQFKEITAAYDLLSDPKKRARFDRGEIDAMGAERPSRGYYRPHAEGGQGAKYQQFDFGEGAGAEDIFADLFGGRRGGRGAPKLRGADVSYVAAVDFVEAAIGARKRLTLADGKTLDVTIPAGTTSGQTLRLKGQGQPGLGGGLPGDALIEIEVQPHPFFTRQRRPYRGPGDPARGAARRPRHRAHHRWPGVGDGAEEFQHRLGAAAARQGHSDPRRRPWRPDRAPQGRAAGGRRPRADGIPRGLGAEPPL